LFRCTYSQRLFLLSGFSIHFFAPNSTHSF
jgi:hypothetical protein